MWCCGIKSLLHYLLYQNKVWFMIQKGIEWDWRIPKSPFQGSSQISYIDISVLHEIKIRVLVLNVHRKQCILERKGAIRKKGTAFTDDI